MKALEANMKALESKIDDRFDAIDDRFDAIDDRFDAIDDRFDRIEDTIDDLRSEVRGENIVTRSLINQAFEHISDQMANKDQSIQPSGVFLRTRPRSRGVPV
jgi:archaellum component FlaC